MEMDRANRNNRNNIGRVHCYSRNFKHNNIKFKRTIAFAGATIISFFAGLGITAHLNEEALKSYQQNGYFDSYNSDDNALFKVDSSEYIVNDTNDFTNDNNYSSGDEINISDCDFSNITVVLNAADESEELYNSLYSTKEQFDSLGIDCSVVSYYDSAIDEIERIKNEMDHTVYVATVQNGQNKWNEHFVMTNYYNNSDALGSPIELGDANSADVFALAVKSSLPSNTKLKKGLQSDNTEYDRKPSRLEEEILQRNLTGVKAITIRPSEVHSLSSTELQEALINGVIKASTLDNNQTYFVRAGSNQTYQDNYGNSGNYAVSGSIKNRYPNAPQPEYAFEEDTFYSDAAILTRPIPVQLTQNISINYNTKLSNTL